MDKLSIILDIFNWILIRTVHSDSLSNNRWVPIIVGILFFALLALLFIAAMNRPRGGYGSGLESYKASGCFRVGIFFIFIGSLLVLLFQIK